MDKKKDQKPPKSDPNSVDVQCYKHENTKTQEAKVAKTYLNPAVLSASLLKSHYKSDDVNVNALIDELNHQTEALSDNDLSRPEAILIAQAHTLDALFCDMALRAKANMGEHLGATDKYMKLALKAQSQCRTTIEALCELKNPKPYIQNNKAQYQQVNNGFTSRAQKKSKNRNELLEEQQDEQWVDAGTSKKTIRDDKELETLGTQYGSEE